MSVGCESPLRCDGDALESALESDAGESDDGGIDWVVGVGVVDIGGAGGVTVGETMPVEDEGGTTGATPVLAVFVVEVPLVDAPSLGLLLPAHAVRTNVSRGNVKARIRLV